MADASKPAAQAAGNSDQMPRGRYAVGCCDLEWAKFGPNTSVNIHGSTVRRNLPSTTPCRPHHVHGSTVRIGITCCMPQHLVARIFYPCTRQPGVTYHPMPWFSDSRYVEGGLHLVRMRQHLANHWKTGYIKYLFWESTSWRTAFLKPMARGIGHWEASTMCVLIVQHNRLGSET